MGKIVKHCAACDESFAERFAFCPNCGKEMTAFEMNPVMQTPVIAETPKAEEAKIEEPIIEEPQAAVPAEESSVVQPVFRSSAPTFEKTVRTDFVASVSEVETEPVAEVVENKIVEDETPEVEPIEQKSFAASAGAFNGNGNSYDATNLKHTAVAPSADDDGFRVTVIEEKNGKQRNTLLLGTMVIMLIVVTTSTVYLLFSKDLGVGAIGDEGLFSMVVVDDVPMEVEPPKPEENKIGSEGAGGGGGGRKDNEPIGKGTIPPQLKERFVTPSNEDISVTNPAIKITRATKGPQDIIPPNRSLVNGDPNSTNPNRSSGLGPDNLGMGQNGSGGFGNNGRDGMGSNGSGGIGNAPGNNYGNNRGNMGNPPPPPPAAPPKAPAVTQKMKITSKPRADYTDLARQNQVTGTVTVKVTFLSSGQIGSVVPVNGLPYGLTEKAIAAAKAIKFEPATRDGVPTTTVATVQYNFNIY